MSEASEQSIADHVVVVVPTIREDRIKQFLDAWQWPCQVIVVEDNPEKTFAIGGVDHYAWPNIRQDLGTDEWIIPRRTDCIRSYGFWKAYQTGKPYIVTLDDDCLPVEQGGSQIALQFLRKHIENLQSQSLDRWWNTIAGDYPRGYPYEQWTGSCPAGISHGLWTNVLDYDSLSQLHYRRAEPPLMMHRERHVPRGLYFPMCGMNLAWRREYTPLMYFLLMGQDHQGNRYPFDRFGDIWCGIIAKKILDHLGVTVWSGGPFVRHERASNVWANFDKEHEGIKANESFWQWIDQVRLTETTPLRCYKELIRKLADDTLDRYKQQMLEAMGVWSSLYD